MYIRIITLTLVFLSFLLNSCSEKEKAEATESTKRVTQKRIPVEAMIVKKQIIRRKVTFSALLEPIHSVDIISEVSGKVMRIEKELGQYVNKRDTLAYIDHEIAYSRYRQAQAQFLSAKNNLQIARLNLESDSLLFKSGDISTLAFKSTQLALKNAEANLLAAGSALTVAAKALRDTRIRTPFPGLISRSYIDLGKMVQPGQALYHVVDLSVIKATISLPQDVISYVKPGSGAQVTVSALGGQTFEGRLEFISPQADEASGSFAAEIHFPNQHKSGVRAGMTAKVTLFISDPQNRITVPREALIQDNGSVHIYKVQGKTAKLTDVEIAGNFGPQTIVSKGLAEGDTVVTVGHKQLGINSVISIEILH